MIWLGQTTTANDVAKYFSTKRVEVPVIKKSSINQAGDFCTCIQQCIPDIIVFTDGVGTDPLKNDWTSFFTRTAVDTLTGIIAPGTSVVCTITNLDTDTTITFTDPAHGTIYTGDFFKWFKLSWYKVYLALGLGRMQIEITETSLGPGGEVINKFCSEVYNLMSYSDKLANGTVVINSVHTGKLHHGFDYSNLVIASGGDPIPFEQRTRLPGRLVSISPEHENHRLVLNDGNRSSYQIKDQLKPKYRLDIHLVGSGQINPVVFDDLFGSEVYITDYSVYNHVNDPRDYYAKQYVDFPVIRTTTGMPNPRATAKRRTYSFELDYDYDNVFKTNN